MSQYENYIIEQTRLQLLVKDFNDKDENYVREEFLVPLFNSAGYNAFGANYIGRGVKLSKTGLLTRENEREHIYPDFVLYKNNIAIWVIDAKSPKVKLESEGNLAQIKSYSFKLNCKKCILSNALFTLLLEVENGEIVKQEFFVLKDLLIYENWKVFVERLTSKVHFQEIFSFEKALQFYETDNYLDRALIMEVLKSHDYKTIFNYLSNSNRHLFKSSAFRTRALPSILISPYLGQKSSMFELILYNSLNDKSSVVRENYFTTLISHSSKIIQNIPHTIFDFVPNTFLEEFLYLSFLSKSKIGRRILSNYKTTNFYLANYIKQLKYYSPASFPIALLINKTANISFLDYHFNIHILPGLIENIVKDPNVHYETICVLNDCLKFAKKNNQGTYKLLLSSSTRTQADIIEFISKLDIS